MSYGFQVKTLFIFSLDIIKYVNQSNARQKVTEIYLVLIMLIKTVIKILNSSFSEEGSVFTIKL